MKRTLIGMGLSVAMLTLGASGADADALLRLSAGVNTVSCDTSAAQVAVAGGNCSTTDGFAVLALHANNITFTGSVDGWGAGGAGGGASVLGNQPGGVVAVGFEQQINFQHITGANDLTVDFAESGFTLPLGPNLILSGTQTANWAVSTAGDTVDLQVWARPDNALTVPGGGVGGATAFSPQCVSPGGITNQCPTGNSPDVGFTRLGTAFALTGRQIIHQAIGTAGIYSGTVAATSAVPEPASMLLLGTGLFGLARRASRKGRKQNQTI